MAGNILQQYSNRFKEDKNKIQKKTERIFQTTLTDYDYEEDDKYSDVIAESARGLRFPLWPQNQKLNSIWSRFANYAYDLSLFEIDSSEIDYFNLLLGNFLLKIYRN